MRRCCWAAISFFSVWAIAALASENTKPLNEEFYTAYPDKIHNPMPLNPEVNSDGSQDPVPNVLSDQDHENPMPLDETEELAHIPMDFPPIPDTLQEVDSPLYEPSTDDPTHMSMENTLNDEQDEDVFQEPIYTTLGVPPEDERESQQYIPSDEKDEDVFQEPIFTTLGITPEDEHDFQQDNYEPMHLNSFPSPNDIKNPMPLNPDPWDGEGEEPKSRLNGTIMNARGVVGPPTYHGGKVLTSPINVYIIWYGNWGNLGGDQEMIKYFFNNIQSSAWWKMATRYTQTKNGVTTAVTPNVKFVGSVQSPLYKGNSLGSPQIVFSVVNSILDASSLPVDTDGIYFVLTAPNIAVANFCVNFCGWHSGFNYRGASILVAMVPHSASSTSGGTCRTAVGAGPGFGFGASVGGYNMVNVIAHELVESATDPIGNAWYRDSDHYENADMCSWLFGPVQKISNYNSNVQLGSKYFLIQQVFDLKTGRCALA